MSKCSKPIHKKIRIRKDFVLNGQNVFEGDFLEERDINREFQGKMQGLIRRGFGMKNLNRKNRRANHANR